MHGFYVYLLSTSVYAKPTQCRLHQAYAAADTTYAACMAAYARGITCPVEFPLYLLVCIQKKKIATQLVMGQKPSLGPQVSASEWMVVHPKNGHFI